MRNWLIGFYIVEFEQNGEDRAKYGEFLLKNFKQKVNLKGLEYYIIQAFKSLLYGISPVGNCNKNDIASQQVHQRCTYWKCRVLEKVHH